MGVCEKKDWERWKGIKGVIFGAVRPQWKEDSNNSNFLIFTGKSDC